MNVEYNRHEFRHFDEFNVKNRVRQHETNVIHILQFYNEMTNLYFGDKLYHPKKICVKNIDISAKYHRRERQV